MRVKIDAEVLYGNLGRATFSGMALSFPLAFDRARESLDREIALMPGKKITDVTILLELVE